MVNARTPALPPARLALADGSVFHGQGFGATGRRLCVTAEVVFNTALSGYQESLTDPSYTGQILVQTAPLIGNTGVNPEDMESAKVQVSGLIVHELAERHSNFRADRSLSDFLADSGVLGLTGVDTRALTRLLRVQGVVQGCLTDDASIPTPDLVRQARQAPSMAGQNLAALVGCSSEQSWAETLGDWSPEAITGRPRTHDDRPLRVLALDCGAKRNILRHLTDRGCVVSVIPHDTPGAEIVRRFTAGDFDGLFISNGPGDPAAVERTIQSLRDVLADERARDLPVFGICLGHQLVALAAGARTYKLKFGHRGTNQPVRNDVRGRVEITSQNHGFAVDPDTLAPVGARATHIHLNDGTVAGLELLGRPVFSVQFHPEASPGPHDAATEFDRFVNLMRNRRNQGTGAKPSRIGF
jgi:carbamoyl-phosphate synthase small subunit